MKQLWDRIRESNKKKSMSKEAPLRNIRFRNATLGDLERLFLWMDSKKYPLEAPYLQKGKFMRMVNKKTGAPYLEKG